MTHQNRGRSSRRFKLRTGVGLLAVGLLAGLVVTYRPHGIPLGREPTRLAVWVLLVPLGSLAIGLLRSLPWAAVLGAAIGVAVLPWATVLTFSPNLGAPISRQVIALIGSATLLITSLRAPPPPVLGTPATASPPERRGTRWIRWCLILNLASVFNLYLFLIAYSFSATWQLVVLSMILAGLLVGVSLLARSVTGGLLLLAVSAVLMVPGAALFVSAEARSAGEAWLFGFLFAPGVVAAWGTAAVLSKPLVGLLHDTD